MLFSWIAVVVMMVMVSLLVLWSGKVRTTLQACLAAVVLACTLGVTVGCTSTQVKQAAAEIGADIPRVLPYVQSAAAVAVQLGADGLLVQTVSSSVQAGLVQLAALCNTYAASPDATVWASIVTTINTLVDGGSVALLDAAKISNPDSRAKALLVLGALQTALLLIDGVVQRTQTKHETVQAASLRRVKLVQIQQYLDKQQVEMATGYSFGAVMQYEQAQGF